MNAPNKKAKDIIDEGDSASAHLVVFAVDGLTCALDISHAQEIKSRLDIIPVPEAHLTVRGVANLRGQVVTVIDLRVVFGTEPKELDKDSRIVFVKQDAGVIGLLVDQVDDIVIAKESELEPPPANVSGVQGEFFESVYKRDGAIACVLNIDRILQKD